MIFSMKPFLFLCFWVLSGQAVAISWRAHDDGVWKLSFSPDASRFLSAGGDGWIRVWRTKDFTEVSSFRHVTDFKVYDAAFFPDGRVVSTSLDGSRFVWDSQTGKALRKLKGHTLYGATVAVSHDGTRFFTGGSDGWVVVWNARDYSEIARLKVKSPVGIVPIYKSHHIVTASLDGISEWDTDQKEILQSYSESPYFFSLNGAFANAFFAGGSYHEKAELRLVEQTKGTVLQTYGGVKGFVWQTAVSADRRFVGASSFDGPVHVWNLRTGKMVYESEEQNSISLAFLPRGRGLLIGNADGTISVKRF